ncbi:MAG: PadR family transcriptional regulator [Candidatus Neomarinimicrobiota bacterium]
MSENQISNAEAALMGLLAESPKHPYQIEKDVDYRDMRSWTDLSMSSIYKLLNKLEQGGLVKSAVELSEGNRARKTFELTVAGLEALEIKLRELLRKPVVPKDPFHVGIYNSDLLPADEVLDCLKQYRENVVELIDCYGRLEQFLKDSNCSAARLAVATRPRFQWEGELRWLDEYLQELQATD